MNFAWRGALCAASGDDRTNDSRLGVLRSLMATQLRPVFANPSASRVLEAIIAVVKGAVAFNLVIPA